MQKNGRDTELFDIINWESFGLVLRDLDDTVYLPFFKQSNYVVYIDASFQEHYLSSINQVIKVVGEYEERCWGYHWDIEAKVVNFEDILGRNGQLFWNL